MHQSEQRFRCPYCDEAISVLVDHSVAEQAYIEDCEVCCRPISLALNVDDEDRVRLRARRSDD